MSQVVKNPTPAQRYRSEPKVVSAHRDLIASNTFQTAVDYALLEYERELAMVPFDNFNACAAAHLRKVGAHEFVQRLRNLAESPTLPETKVVGQLDHKA